MTVKKTKPGHHFLLPGCLSSCLLLPACLLLTFVMDAQKAPLKTRMVTKSKPEPAGWYAGDIHVHRNCGDSVVHATEEVAKMMETNDLAVMSLLADMGNGEVKYSETDLTAVTGKDISPVPGRVMRWDAEWHWDATYSQFSNQALGGHLVLLGLNDAQQIWDESPYKILEWARKQNAVSGFAHFQYLNDSIQTELNCCIPVDYPVEAALGTIDFISEDVFSSSLEGGGYSSEAVVNAYYKLLNCGFRLGLAAGTDYPCNNNEPPGSMLTYAKVSGPLTYRKWIDEIKNGRTVVSRNAHKEFLDMTVNNSYTMGDDITLTKPAAIAIEVKWSAAEILRGTVELVYNGEVIASQQATAKPGSSFTLKTKRKISESGWICARRMDKKGHLLHTAPVYITVNNQPVRASSKDAKFFVTWIDNILEKTAVGGPWYRYFTKNREEVIERYKKARAIYNRIATEADHAPVLLLASQANFGNYTGEILKAEGLSSFQLDEPTEQSISSENLTKRKLVIVASADLNEKQASILSDYVKNGGNLIIAMPSPQMEIIAGIQKLPQQAAMKYISLNNVLPLTKGLTTKYMRLHNHAGGYQLNGALAIAGFHPQADSPSQLPAVVYNKYGKGQCIAFLYNLPENIVLTRQGNPADAGLEKDGITGIRAMDLFTNGWVDTANNVLNHADEQMRLLSRSIEWVCSKTIPFPKLWYFPDTLSCVVTLNNDGEDSHESEFEPQFQDVFKKGAKMTLYVKETGLVSRPWVEKWRASGFEISGHPDQTQYATDPNWWRMDTVYKTLNTKLKNLLGLPPMRTVTNHWFVWCGRYDSLRYDFAAQAQLEAINGIGLDCNYAHYDNNASESKFLGSYGYTQGNYTGSGLPMKFAGAEGNIIDVYQQLNNVYDQQYMEHKDKDGYFNSFKGLLDRSIYNGVYSYISVRAHNNEYFFSKEPLMKMLDYANSKRVPVWSELMLLDFLRAREESEFRSTKWANEQLTFTLHSSMAGDAKITAIIPYFFNGKRIHQITINGKNIVPYLRKIKDMQYAMVPVIPGISYQFIVTYK